MARPRVIINRAGLRDLLSDPAVVSHLEARMGPALSAARSSAPVETGAYARSLALVTEKHRTRTVVHLVARAKYALRVEGRHGILSRALDAAGGRR